MEILPELPDKSVDVTITDPPYGTTSYSWDKAQDWQAWWKEIKRVTRGRVIVTASLPFTVDMINSNRAGFKYWWIWDKSRIGNFAIAKYQPLRVTEEVLVFEDGLYNPQMTKADPENMRPRDAQYDTGGIIGLKSGKSYVREEHDESERWPVNLLDIPATQNECNQVNRVHPTQKPTALMRYLVLTYSNPGDVILDPFCGSGSTLVAAKQSGRHWLGIEKEKHYADTTKTRLTQEMCLGV
jgi:site-specific DNA-methyltransferase (adenine-specific)